MAQRDRNNQEAVTSCYFFKYNMFFFYKSFFFSTFKVIFRIDSSASSTVNICQIINEIQTYWNCSVVLDELSSEDFN